MQNWKKVVIGGSVAAGALLLLKGRRSAGAALTTAGLVLLASEYPDQFEHFWENAPDYITRGSQIFSTVQRIAERFADEASRRGVSGALREVGSDYIG
ncbi:MAG TPA: hypothetical protein VG897_13295 [Terriglobales bacterium]|nr:hypothetical protein [Terriglobales bacterium]